MYDGYLHIALSLLQTSDFTIFGCSIIAEMRVRFIIRERRELNIFVVI